jgi:hypothetical protein
MSTSPISFSGMYEQFVAELKTTFPEFSSSITQASTLPDAHKRFTDVWRNHTKDVASQNNAIFTPTGIELIPGFVMTASLWGELSKTTQNAIWKYISSLLLLAANMETDGKSFWDLSGFQADMEEMMKHLKSEGAAADMKGIFENLGKMAETFGFKDFGKDMSGAGAKFKLPERLFKGHIAKIAEELVKEFKPEDFGISPDVLESDDPARVFTYLQELFTKNPETLMAAAKKIASKIQKKFETGAIKREDIIREAEELMAEFQENDAFSSLFGSLGEILKGSEKESGNEGSARRREVQERLRKQKAEKDAKKAAAAGGVPQNTFSAVQEAAANAAMAALLAEEDTGKKSNKIGKRK